MNKQIEIIRNTRNHLLNFISDLSVEELNEIPKGFNNNIIWNFIHLISAQQSSCYIRAGLPCTAEEKYVHPFKPDTKPERLVDEAEIKHVKHLFLSVIDQLEADYDRQIFGNYVSWTNRYGVEISTIDEMLGFLPFHEGLHLGYIMALKRTIRTKQ